VNRFFVLYTEGDDIESWEVEAEFDTLLAAKKYIERANKAEDASDYHGSVSWEYHIVQWISGVKTEITVKKCLESYALKLKGARK